MECAENEVIEPMFREANLSENVFVSVASDDIIEKGLKNAL